MLPGENVVDGEKGALTNVTTGDFNTAMGARALLNLTTGNTNTAFGQDTLIYNNNDGNSAFGVQALRSNKGTNNVAVGINAMGGGVEGNAQGDNNTAIGTGALYGNDGGNNNIGVGFTAGTNNVDGSNNIYVGNTAPAAPPGVGNAPTTSESGTIRIGTDGTHTATYIAGINGYVDRNAFYGSASDWQTWLTAEESE